MRTSKVEKLFAMFRYLQRNTNKDHPVNEIDLIRALGELAEGNRALNGTINDLANVLNRDEDDVIKPRNEWLIIFDAFEQAFNPELPENSKFPRELEDGRLPVKHVYFQSPFTDKDIDNILDGIMNNSNITQSEKNKLQRKVRKYLTSKYYRHHR